MAEAQGWDSSTFSFSPEFQKQIIASMIQEPKLFERLGLYISPNNFEVSEYGKIYKGIQSFYSEYKGIPSKEACYELVKKYHDTATLADSIDELYNHKRIASSTIEFIEDSVKNFIQCQALKNAILESIEDLGDVNKHLKVKERVEEALQVCAGLEDLGVNVYDFDEVVNRWDRRANNSEVKRYSTGWTEFDKIFGGYGIGEVFSFMGPANSGKSMYLINAGANLLLQKKNVLHISLEMSEEITEQRYDMRLLGLTKEELTTGKGRLGIKELLKKSIGGLVVKRYPSSTITATEISSYMTRLENIKGFVPDILIIDYADIMRSSNHYLDKRNELDMIYQEVRNIAIEHNLPVITATQLNRAALEKLESGKILTEESIAESYGIARIIDCGVTINATPASNAQGESTIYVCKNRSGEAGGTFRCAVDFSRASVREWDAPNISAIKNKMKKK